MATDPTTPSDLDAFKLPGAASLYEQLDKLVLVCLRDGRTFYGWLRSFDQYANLVLDNTVERLHDGDSYADIQIGIFVIRGENVMLLGEVDEKKEMELSTALNAVSEKDIRRSKEELRQSRGALGKSDKSEWAIPEEF